MITPRETIYAALFALASSAASFKKKSRRAVLWSDISPVDMPYLGMSQGSETAETKTKQPTIWHLNVDMYVYVSIGNDPNVVGTQLLNPILDQLTALFDPQPASAYQTLGGLVHYCRVNGSIEIADEGVLGTTAVAIIPIEILVT